MQIIHKIDDFLFHLFPKVTQSGNSLDVLKEEVSRYYTFGPYKPSISIENGWLYVTIDSSTILSQEADFRKVVSLCESRRFKEAKPILSDLIKANKTNSEYYRIYGQILSEEGNQEEAINYLIDALKWDSKNKWALLLMGNIFAKHKDDIYTAMKYYDQALKVDPKNQITINNIGANLLQQGKIEAAEKYFQEALKIDATYPNTWFALGLIAEKKKDFITAFNNSVIAIKNNTNTKDALFDNSIGLALSTAKKIVDIGGGKFYTEYLRKVEIQCNVKIELLEDRSTPTAAKLELAENHNRSNHLIRYNPDYPAIVHLLMHELVHLAFIVEARKANSNLLFITTQQHKSNFIKRFESNSDKLKKTGNAENFIADFYSNLFNGLNLQVFNAPIDLFVEKFLYAKFEDFRPYQFLSLFNLLNESLKAITDKNVAAYTPAEIISYSKIYNIVSALQFKDLYGIDIISKFTPSSSELSKAKGFYTEFLQHKDNKEPAEEYELVLNWAEALGLDQNFEFVDENEYNNKRTNIDGLLESIENDPFGLESKDIYRKRSEEKFQKSQREIGTNMAVVMFMVDGLNYFEKMPKEQIKKIAFEIALLGTQGINPDKKGYRVGSIHGKEFSGYHVLAFYYVSWKLTMPEMVSQLNLPYEKEYELAQKLINQ